jgi:hypothetical protein
MHSSSEGSASNGQPLTGDIWKLGTRAIIHLTVTVALRWRPLYYFRSSVCIPRMRSGYCIEC